MCLRQEHGRGAKWDTGNDITGWAKLLHVPNGRCTSNKQLDSPFLLTPSVGAAAFFLQFLQFIHQNITKSLSVFRADTVQKRVNGLVEVPIPVASVIERSTNDLQNDGKSEQGNVFRAICLSRSPRLAWKTRKQSFEHSRVQSQNLCALGSGWTEIHFRHTRGVQVE